MPLNAIQNYVKGLLDGAQLPLGQGTLQAFITPPDPGEGTDPTIYIWGSVAHEKRQTMPRHQPGNYSSGGFKWIEHTIDLWLVFCAYADDEMVDSLFPAVIDSVMAILRDTQMQVPIIDPVTGMKSTVEMIGEVMTWDYAPVHSLEDQRMLRYTARLTVDVKELIQA
jgi:hypothetical protein